MTRPTLLIICLLTGGGLLWWSRSTGVADFDQIDPPSLIAVLVGVVLASFSVVRRAIGRRSAKWRRPDGRQVWINSAVVAVLSCVALYAIARGQGRPLLPVWHDEHSYLIQTQLIASGKLWGPRHPLADFFENHYVFVDPVYASMYFPGTGMVYAPGVWLNLPTWLAPLVVAGLCAAMLYRIFTELFDGRYGVLAVILFIGSSAVRMLSVMVMSNLPMLLMVLLAYWGWLCWRRQPGWRWAALIGFFASWALIIRPLDAICLLVPIALMMLVEARRLRVGSATLGASIAVGLLATAPMLGVMAVYNHAITGAATKFPHDLYVDLYMPGANFGFHDHDETARPQSDLITKQLMHRMWASPANIAHTVDRVPEMLLSPRPDTGRVAMMLHAVLSPLLLLAVPAGLLMLRDPRGWPLVLAVPLFAGLYVFYCFFAPQYSIIAVPGLIALTLGGIRAFGRLVPRGQRYVEVALILVAVLLVIVGNPLVNPQRGPDQFFLPRQFVTLDRMFRELPVRPAIVLFAGAGVSATSAQDPPAINPHIEFVYNIDRANPDDAPIIRAHDLGARNAELFAYYAARQPERFVYRLDTATGQLTAMGTVKDLASASR